MAYKRYTSCFLYPSGGKPYNESDRAAWIAEQLLLAVAIGGTFTLVGLLAGPFGAVIGAILGSIVGLTNFLDNAADQWLNHRLICLNKDNPQCAVGVVSYNPNPGELGNWDNDEFFDVVLMPHPPEPTVTDAWDKDITWYNPISYKPANRYVLDGKKVVIPSPYDKYVGDHSANELYATFQGQDLLTIRDDIQKDLGSAELYHHERACLHCEAEGDFWVRIRQLAPALALLIMAALAVTAATTAAGAAAGGAAGCAIGSFFFGPIGCAIGALLGSLLGGAAGAAAGALGSYFGAINPILQAIFEAGRGNVEDANVGDKDHSPIRMGDQVAVLGEHVYDGYHTGWTEFHPLMACVKTGPPIWDQPAGSKYYLVWQPALVPPIIPDMPPGETIALTEQDMHEGLNSDRFLQRCKNLKNTWCGMLQDAFDENTRTTQQGLEHRWTIHPAVDGCRSEPAPPPGPH
jgi:hypothetical protein